MSGTLVLLESNTTGTGRLFARAAVALGYRPLLLCADPARYPYAAEDGVPTQVVDTADLDDVLAACRALDDIAGITSSSEYFIAAAAAAARALALPGADAEAISRCRDKEAQREALAEAGVGIPRFVAASTVGDARVAAEKVGLPVVLKPVAGSGSVGVRLCHDDAEVAAHAQALLANTVNERGMPVPARLLVEELAVGPELSVECFSGAIVGIVRKHVGEPPWFVEVGHDFPAPLADDDRLAVEATARAALDALGLDFGPAHVEVRVTDDGPVVMEVNPRLAGGNIPELLRHASGVDLVRETVRLATGGRPHLDATRHRHAAIRFVVAPGTGTVGGVHGVEQAAAVDHVVDVRVATSRGDEVALRGDFRDRIGHVLACADSEAAARAAAEQAVACIEVEVS